MKFIKTLTLAIAATCFVACSDSEEILTNDDNDNGGVELDPSLMSYTDNPNHAYFLIKNKDEEVDGKKERVKWSNQGSQTNATSYFDGVANTFEISKLKNSRWLFPAAELSLANNKEEIKSIDDKNFEWYLPSRSELMLMMLYNGVVNLEEDIYWSSSEWINNSNYRDLAWKITPKAKIPNTDAIQKDGVATNSIGTNGNDGAFVRSVKKVDAEGKKYPYVKSKTEPIIVSRDADGGVKKDALRAEFPLQATSDEFENKISQSFEVDLTDTGSTSWEGAKKLCHELNKGGHSNWRVPTSSEMQLIWIMGGGYAENGSKAVGGGISLNEVTGFIPLDDAKPNRPVDGAGEYWASNPEFFMHNFQSPGGEEVLIGYRMLGRDARFIAGNGPNSFEQVRCVRDVE